MLVEEYSDALLQTLQMNIFYEQRIKRSHYERGSRSDEPKENCDFLVPSLIPLNILQSIFYSLTLLLWVIFTASLALERLRRSF